MARTNFNNVAIDTAGNALSGVQVTVIDTSDDSSATLYQNMGTSGTQKTNPFTTGATGLIDFKVETGTYRIDLHDTVVPARFTDRSLYWDSVPGGLHTINILQVDWTDVTGDVHISNLGVTTLQNNTVDTNQLVAEAVTAAKLADDSVTNAKLALGFGTTNIVSPPIGIGTGWTDVIDLDPNPATFLLIANIQFHNSSGSSNYDVGIRFMIGSTPSDQLASETVGQSSDRFICASYIGSPTGTQHIKVQAQAEAGGQIFANSESTLTRLMID